MTEQISNFFTIEMIYLWLNIGVVPIWLILIFFPRSKFCSFLITSIVPYLIFGSIYVYLVYYFYLLDYDFLRNFNLYIGLDELIDLFENKYFLLIFWIHFLAINLFCGGWIVNDSQKLGCNKFLVMFPIVITYFVGPAGIFLYWLIKIFYAKRISLYD